MNQEEDHIDRAVPASAPGEQRDLGKSLLSGLAQVGIDGAGNVLAYGLIAGTTKVTSMVRKPAPPPPPPAGRHAKRD
jgi:hypothetical protein